MVELFRKIIAENEVSIQRKNMVVTFEGIVLLMQIWNR